MALVDLRTLRTLRRPSLGAAPDISSTPNRGVPPPTSYGRPNPTPSAQGICGPGSWWNPVTKSCGTDLPPDDHRHPACPVGWWWHTGYKRCEPGCPPGFRFDSVRKICISNAAGNVAPPPVAAAKGTSLVSGGTLTNPPTPAPDPYRAAATMPAPAPTPATNSPPPPQGNNTSPPPTNTVLTPLPPPSSYPPFPGGAGGGGGGGGGDFSPVDDSGQETAPAAPPAGFLGLSRNQLAIGAVAVAVVGYLVLSKGALGGAKV